jgi:hypothetical protein
MARRAARELTVEEFDNWNVATGRYAAIGKAADEEGGPSLSLVPATERNEVWPTDLLPPAAPEPPAEPSAEPSGDGEPGAEASADVFPNAPAAAMPFDGIELEDSRKRLAGWSAERQRVFLVNLAETGSVHLAAASARLTARSAYRLRARSPAFAAAWDTADQLAVGRLSAIAFDRAINGRTEQVWQEGELVAEKRLPSDRLLMWLLTRLDPRRFAAPWELRKDGAADPQAQARESFPALLDALADTTA